MTSLQFFHIRLIQCSKHSYSSFILPMLAAKEHFVYSPVTNLELKRSCHCYTRYTFSNGVNAGLIGMSVLVRRDRERGEIGSLYHWWVSAISSSQLDIPQSFSAAWQCLLLITSVHLSHLALHLVPAVDSPLHICVHRPACTPTWAIILRSQPWV